MKTAAWMLFGALVLVMRMDFAVAAVITVNVTGHVVYSADSTGILADQVFTGQAITASYTYDTNTSPTNSQWYQPNMPPAGATVTIGQLSFQSVAPTQPGDPNQSPFWVNINLPSAPGSGDAVLLITSNSNQLLKAGTPVQPVNRISFYFDDRNGQWPADASLPTGIPALASLIYSSIGIDSGTVPGFNINIQIDSVTLASPTFDVSPASGNFLPPQHFDAALLLPVGMQVASVQVSVNGNSVPFLSYPGQCTQVPNGNNQTAIVCPNASQVFGLPPPPGPPAPTLVTWQVTLTDGTVINKTVSWNLVF